MISQTNGARYREGRVDVVGGRVWYKVVGYDSPRTPLIVINGGPGLPHGMMENMNVLADERPVMFYDQLGCGQSDHNTDVALLTVERYADEVDKIRKALDLDEVHILGMSWGTMVVVDYMLNIKPRGVKSLVLSGPCLSAPRWEADVLQYLDTLPEQQQAAIRDCEARHDYTSPAYMEAMMAFYKRYVCRLDPWPEMFTRALEGLSKPVYEYMWGPSEFTITGTLRNYDRVGRLKEIEAPTLFTCGQYDEAAPKTTAFYRDNLPGSKLAVVEGASHMTNLEKPDEYIGRVREFLAANDVTRRLK